MAERFETKTVHFHHPHLEHEKAKATPIYQTSVFSFPGLEEVEDFYAGGRNYLYTRNGNPNQVELAEAVAALEQAERGVAAASGMGAIMAGVLAVVKPGERILASHEIYGGTYALLHNELARLGIELALIDLTKSTSLDDAITPNTRLFYMESITNPLLTVADMPHWIKEAKRFGLITMIDNTFATPYLVQPARLGADLIVHSATKYIGGHSDVTAGVLTGKAEYVERAREIISTYGASLSPFEAWLGARGIKTLALRMERQCENAAAVAHFLESHPSVSRVYYPREEDVQFFHRHKRGAMVSFCLSEEEKVYDFYRRLRWITLSPSLAGVETTVSHPVTTSHRALTEEQRLSTGITQGLVRLSVGIEASEDIIDELNQALV
ncbi:trans-sulfuration enzyme family protein [Brevibacillus fluminis]|uniref:trans-sulfuration enzyme family protein n=1 Tax=Brevibacillus fluminis TaxID=511487 RepID=UPI003F8A371D